MGVQNFHLRRAPTWEQIHEHALPKEHYVASAPPQPLAIVNNGPGEGCSGSGVHIAVSTITVCLGNNAFSCGVDTWHHFVTQTPHRGAGRGWSLQLDVGAPEPSIPRHPHPNPTPRHGLVYRESGTHRPPWGWTLVPPIFKRYQIGERHQGPLEWLQF